MHKRFCWKSIVVLIMVAVCSASSTRAQEKNEKALTVRVTGIRNTNGTVLVLLFKGPEGFPGDRTKAFGTQALKIGNGGVAIGIFTVPDDQYAVAVFHDENGNAKLDKNLMGVPKEGYGFSNNPIHKMRPARFDEASFRVIANRSVDIAVGY